MLRALSKGTQTSRPVLDAIDEVNRVCVLSSDVNKLRWMFEG